MTRTDSPSADSDPGRDPDPGSEKGGRDPASRIRANYPDPNSRPRFAISLEPKNPASSGVFRAISIDKRLGRVLVLGSYSEDPRILFRVGAGSC